MRECHHHFSVVDIFLSHARFEYTTKPCIDLAGRLVPGATPNEVECQQEDQRQNTQADDVSDSKRCCQSSGKLLHQAFLKFATQPREYCKPAKILRATPWSALWQKEARGVPSDAHPGPDTEETGARGNPCTKNMRRPVSALCRSSSIAAEQP